MIENRLGREGDSLEAAWWKRSRSSEEEVRLARLGVSVL